jgi:hypothetical protein
MKWALSPPPRLKTAAATGIPNFLISSAVYGQLRLCQDSHLLDARFIKTIGGKADGLNSIRESELKVLLPRQIS